MFHRAVSTNEAMAYAAGHGASYIETSARTGHNVDTFLEWLTRQSYVKYLHDAVGEQHEIIDLEQRVLRSSKSNMESCCAAHADL